METKAEESVQNAIDYFKNLYNVYPADVFRQRFLNIMKERLERTLEGNAKGTSKGIIKGFVDRCGHTFVDSIDTAMREACIDAERNLMEIKSKIRAIYRLEKQVDDLRQEIEDLRIEKEGIEVEIDTMREAFPDPKARTAYELFSRISTDETDDTYTKQRRITSAGLVAAAYLGLQHYEINTGNNQKKD